MKEWWNNLSLRDKQLFALGLLAVIFFLIYSLVWSPLDNKVSALRTTLQHNQKLLTWMQAADKQIESYKNTSQTTTAQSTGSLLSIVQNEINQSSLSKDLSQLHQAEDDSVQLSFQHVGFDPLIRWLTQLWQQHNITITRASIKKTEASGIVSAEIVLK
jgi:general secretion pathway protein M